MSTPHAQLFESRRIVDQDGRSLSPELAGSVRWLSSFGCFVQANNRHFNSSLSSETVVKPGVLISIVLKGIGSGGPWGEGPRLHYGDNTLVALALRQPMRWWGRIPRGAHVQAIGLAFPVDSLRRLSLWDDFTDLFNSAATDIVTAAMKVGPRLQAIATEMLAPPLDGNLGRLLLESHAAEVYAHRGKFICVAGQQLFVGDTAEEVLAQAQAAHPEDGGRFTRYIPVNRADRIYAH